MLRKTFFVLCCFVFLLFSSDLFSQVSKTSLNLMPYPEKVILKEGKFRLDSSFTIGITGKPNKRIYPYTSRVLQRLDKRTISLFKQGYLDSINQSEKPIMTIYCKSPGKVSLGMDESYELNISTDIISLKAETDIGAIRGLETFLQLLFSDEKGYYFPCVEINDKPRFQWRGLLIDVSRHFYPIDLIKRNIDGMAAVKMNVLHLHLSDDQGFRVECKTFPKLNLVGSNGLYYTQSQIKDIIAYADERGIRVVPEFDMPGHSTSWFAGYPELASGNGTYNVGKGFGVYEASMNPAKKYTYKFLSAFIKEMAKLFPDEYFHIGGDENSGKEWDNNQSIQKFMKKKGIKSNDELQKYFNQNILKILTKNKKKMMGWDEIFQPGLPNNIVIQSWRGKDYMVDAAKNGYQTVLSNGYYIDLAESAAEHYLNDPLPDSVKLNEQQKKFILGGEATMWSEITSDETVDSRIWPRTAAIAERLWSPESVKDTDDMYRRLDIISFQLEEVGLTHIKNRDMMMRRLLGNDSIEALKTFIDAVGPWKEYKRHSEGIGYSTTTPLSRVADIAVPDEPVARHFNKSVDLYIKKPCDSLYKIILSQLQLWKSNHAAMLLLISKVPSLKEIKVVSENLDSLSSIGLQVLNYLNNGKKPDKKWLEEKRSVIKECKQPAPKSEVEIAIIPAIEELLNALENVKK